jgi:hypothetical protein
MKILHRLQPYLVRGVRERGELICDGVSSPNPRLLFDGGGLPLPAHIIHAWLISDNLIWAL